MESPSKNPSSWGKVLLLGGNIIVFMVLITQLALPNLLTNRVIHLPVERDLSILSQSSQKMGNLPPQAITAYQNLNRLQKLPKNFDRSAPKARQKALKKWEKWWGEKRGTIQVSGFNGLVFVAVLLCIFGMMGFIQIENSSALWKLVVLAFFLNSMAFFVLFTQYDKTSLGGFYAFSFALSIFTLGYLARPEVQPSAPSPRAS